MRWIGEDRMRLLEVVRDQGSISAAGRALGLSYKTAWDTVHALNNLFSKPLVIARPGGLHGGGAQLTPEGEAVLRNFYRLQEELARYLASLQAHLADHGSDHPPDLLLRFIMKTSARNALRCTIDKVIEGAVNAEVIMGLGEGIQLCAIVTNQSVRELELAPAKEVIALIKSSFVILAPEDQIHKTSARNRLLGTVIHREEGAVNNELTLDIGGGKTLTAIITKDSAEELGLHEGSRACALIKASHIILAVD